MLQQRHALRTGIIAAFVSMLAMGFSGTSAAAESCDRACLSGLITQYVDALVAHDPSKLPLAENVRVTEDSKAIKLGDGVVEDGDSEGPVPP